MKLPKEKIENQIFSVPSGKAKLVWNGFAWDRFKEVVEDTDSIFKVNVNSHKEIPSGSVDGINFIFTLSQNPEINSEHVFLNGLLQKSGEDYDYIIYGSSIYFVEPPYEGSTILCSYSTPIYKEKNNEIAERVSSKVYCCSREIILGKEMIYLNGLLQMEGVENDYTIDSNFIKFRENILETDIVIISYQTN